MSRPASPLKDAYLSPRNKEAGNPRAVARQLIQGKRDKRMVPFDRKGRNAVCRLSTKRRDLRRTQSLSNTAKRRVKGGPPRLDMDYAFAVARRENSKGPDWRGGGAQRER